MTTEVEIKTTYGKSARANVRVLGNKVKVMFDDENGAAREFSKDDAPEGIATISGVCVNLNYAGDVIYGVRPWDGTHLLRFKRFVRDQEGLVSMKHREAREVKLPPDKEHPHGRKWNEPNRLTFTAIVGVQTKGMEWMEASVTLDHVFEKASNGKMKLSGAPGYTKTMQNFLQLAGYDFSTDSIDYGDTLLDELEEILLDRDVIFQGEFKEGWLKGKTLSNPPVGTNRKKAPAKAKPKAKPKAKRATAKKVQR